MTTPGRGDPLDDLTAQAYSDADERTESEWLLARERDPAAPPPSAKIASDYAELEELLGDLPAGSTDERWHDEVLQVVRSAPRAPAPRAPQLRWYRSFLKWLLGGGLVAAAALSLLALFLRVPTELDVAIRHGDATSRGTDEVSVGDHVIVTAQPRGPGDLRIYRSSRILVARCPTGPACRVSPDGAYTIDVALDAPVQYQVVLVVGTIDASPGGTPSGTIDAYLSAAGATSARVIVQTIDVR
jgi:hypothetical protein